MEKTQYSAARFLIVVVMLLSIATGAMMVFASLAMMSDARTEAHFWLGLVVGVGGFLFAAVAYALYEFFKAFLDLVDNSYVIKQELMSKTKMERS